MTTAISSPYRVMSNKASIYSYSNPEIIKLFERAGHPAKVLCVALDYAKGQHTVLICNGLGDRVKGTFVVDNTPAGAKLLLGEVRQCAKQRKIPAAQIFFGGEDYPSFAENFLRHLRQEDFLVLRVNAWEAKQQRSNFQASTDALDLLGIARCCLNRRGQPVEDLPVAYANLRLATRDRDKLVRSATATSNRIHTYVDRLFPGFLSEAKSGLTPFCEASLDLMAERFSPAELRRRPQGALGQWLARRGVSEPHAAAAQLKDLAKGALAPAPEQTVLLQRTLSQLVGLYRGLQGSIGTMDRELAYWLARTPGALLTSIGGHWHHAGRRLDGRAGAAATVARSAPDSAPMPGWCPKTKQTGGPDKEPVAGYVQQRCNKRLKNVVLQAVEKVRQFGPEDLRRTAQELEAHGAHTEFALAKRLVRLGKYLAITGTIYRPKALMGTDTPQGNSGRFIISRPGRSCCPSGRTKPT